MCTDVHIGAAGADHADRSDTASMSPAARRSSRTAFRAYPRQRREVVYPARVSDKPPQTYILHTVVLFIVLVTAMVLFLRYQWG